MKQIGNYSIEKEPLGKGQFGQVFKCHLKTDPTKKFAVKIIPKKLVQAPRLFNNLKNEINILTKIDSPNVVKLFDLQRTDNNFYLILELCNGGDLLNLKEIRTKFNEQEARVILKQLVAGFKEIYKQQVMHRDLKLANILVNFPGVDFGISKITNPIDRSLIMGEKLRNIDLIKSNMQVKIADLGFARELSYEDVSETVCGTPLVMAPEVLNGKRYNHKADVWSLGIVFFEMITGFAPFTGRDKNDLKKNLDKGDYKLPKKLQLSLMGLDFLNGCLQFDQEKRMSWSQLIDHPYIKLDDNDNPEEQMHLSYSEYHGQYIRADMDEGGEDSTILLKHNPYTYLNERNAILLNCKDPQTFQEVYEKAVQRHFKNHIINSNPVLKLSASSQNNEGKLAQTMGKVDYQYDDEEDIEDNREEEEKKLCNHEESKTVSRAESLPSWFDKNAAQNEQSDGLTLHTNLASDKSEMDKLHQKVQSLQLKMEGPLISDDRMYIIDEKIKIKSSPSKQQDEVQSLGKQGGSLFQIV